ncbi:MAG: hypothetical protein AAF456_22305 [Planctomycetota bacterium]
MIRSSSIVTTTPELPVQPDWKFCAIMRLSERRSGRSRKAFSLLELILVLAIIIFVSALSIPALSKSFQQQAVSKGGDMLRAAMGEARVKAMRTGQIHAVYYIPGDSFFSVAPLDSAGAQMQVAQMQRRQIELGNDMSEFGDDRLPRGVFFAAADAQVDTRAMDALDQAEGGGASGSMRKLLFYPDGSSQNAVVILQNERGQLVQVTLRGLTGNSFSQRVDQSEAFR